MGFFRNWQNVRLPEGPIGYPSRLKSGKKGAIVSKRPKMGILILLMLLIWGCSPVQLDAESRAKAAQRSGELLVGIAWPFSVKQDHFREGVELAVQEINDQGGVLGKNVKPLFEDDAGSVSQGKKIAQIFVEQPSLIAVIGHYNSYISIPCAVIYEYYGLLMLSPGSTSPRLTTQGFQRVFRTIPSDEQIGAQLAELAKRRNHSQMILLYEDSPYGVGLANAIEFQAERLNLIIKERIAYDSGMKNYSRILEKIRVVEFDGIFLAGYAEDANLLIRQARNHGITVPFMGGDGLDSPNLWKEEPEQIEGTILLSVLHKNNPGSPFQTFSDRYSQFYQTIPDGWAAQGYEAIHLLAAAIEKAQSLDPDKIADVLRSQKDWQGLNGVYSFDESGEIQNKNLTVQIVRGQKLEYLPD